MMHGCRGAKSLKAVQCIPYSLSSSLPSQRTQALLSERITDCRVHAFSHERHGEDAAAEMDDYSHLNYQRSAVIMAEMRERLERLAGEGAGHDEEDTRGLANLRNEATLSLARVLTKQGGVGAMLGHHRDALVRSCRASLLRGVAVTPTSSHVFGPAPLGHCV